MVRGDGMVAIFGYLVEMGRGDEERAMREFYRYERKMSLWDAQVRWWIWGSLRRKVPYFSAGNVSICR